MGRRRARCIYKFTHHHAKIALPYLFALFIIKLMIKTRLSPYSSIQTCMTLAILAIAILIEGLFIFLFLQ